MKIQDGTGTQNTARVTGDNRLSANSVSIPSEHFIARNTGKVWSITFKDIDPAGADDYFLYIKNNSNVNEYNISDILMTSTVAGQLEMQVVSGTATGGTTNTPVSRKVGSVATPDTTIETGVDITGLTNDGIMYLLTLSANTNKELLTASQVVIQPGQAVALLWGESTGILSGTITLVEEPVNFDF
jgi:hypothetical protein